ncbi:MAG: sugar phosphate isomerase/epimerase [Clostridia bacterium]|nr:sugar phosphate isomerase/epimerase [Clostridia bacterium]
MNIGIRLHDTLPGTPEERLDAVRQQGFSCIHLAMQKVIPGFKMQDAPELLTRELAGKVRGALEDRGIGCAVLGCYLKLADPDNAAAEKTRRIYEAHLRFAGWMGAGCVGTETPPAPAAAGEGEACHTEALYQLFLERIRPVARFAREEGVDLAVEPVCSHIIHDAPLAERMLSDLGCDRVKIILDAVNLIDSAHVDCAEDIITDAVRRLGERTAVLHFKDFVPDPGAPRPTPVACGTGHMYYDALLRLAAANGLPITLENTKPENAQASRLFLERTARQMGI